MNIYEQHGRLVEAHEKAQDDLKQTLALLGEVARGKIAPVRVTVTETGWQVAPEPSGDDGDKAAPEVAGRVGEGNVGTGKAG